MILTQANLKNYQKTGTTQKVILTGNVKEDTATQKTNALNINIVKQPRNIRPTDAQRNPVRIQGHMK